MGTTSDGQVARLIARAERDPDVLAVMLFGSRAREEARPGSETDICLVLDADPPFLEASTRKRLAIFQQLPLHLRSRVLREGRVLFVRDEDRLYALACRTARAFEYFRPYYRRYLDAVARG